MAKTKITQADRLLKYIRDFGSITRYQAMLDLGIANATSVIDTLRKNGYNIVADMQKTKNRYGEIVHYAKWILVEEEQQ